MNQTAKIDVTKIDKAHLFQGKSGKYLDLIFFENKDGPDKYGNDGFIVQGISKEARDKGERGPIIGNWKRMNQGAESRYKRSTTGTPAKAPVDAKPETDPDEDLPF